MSCAWWFFGGIAAAYVIACVGDFVMHALTSSDGWDSE